MKRLLNALSKFSKVNGLTQKIIDHEIRQVNLIRSFMITGFAVPVALVLSFLYTHDVNNSSISFIDWKRNILDLNISVAAISAVLFVLNIIAYSKPSLKRLNKALPHVIVIIMVLWGTICAIYDQSISTSILAFLLIVVPGSMSLLINPSRLFMYLVFIYIVFYIGLTATQHDLNILLSNLSIGFITMVICLGMAIIQWRNNITKFSQRRLIKTQKKELEHNYAKLLVTSEELMKANQSKDKFFSILAHDLRGPISSTLALTHYLEEGLLEKDETERRRLYKLLQSSLDTTSKLLENVLLWSRSQTGNISFKPREINLESCLQQNIDFLKIVAAQKDIEVTHSTDSAINILADADMMNTIFRNLLSNAIKFTPNFGKVEVSSGSSIDVNAGTKLVTISVKDSGMGMSQKTLDSLFKIEQKTIFPGTNNEIGTGLGLVLCKEFILKHSGKIMVESKEQEGSKFVITLPA